MILAIIQARMASTRLPGKTLMKIRGKTLIEHMIERIKASRYIKKIVIATTENPSDDVLVDLIRKNLPDCDIFRGSESNVLERFYKCALKYKPDVIVRLTADDPLKDAEVIDAAISVLLADPSLDYVSNTLSPSYPEGLDVEVFTFKSLEKTYKEARAGSEKEHVTPYIWKNPDIFKVKNISGDEDLSSWRWTVDKPEDLEFVRRIYERFYDTDPIFSFKKVIKFLKSDPELLKINSGNVRNEGYLKSLKEDKNNGHE